jgi:metal-responsive CopG/Arc/MetJ family transcriptional regulator
MKRNGTRSRSRLIEDAARESLARRARAAREARDLAILNEAADALNREMDDVLAYQVPRSGAQRRTRAGLKARSV